MKNILNRGRSKGLGALMLLALLGSAMPGLAQALKGLPVQDVFHKGSR